jgi:hypothetical protein
MNHKNKLTLLKEVKGLFKSNYPEGTIKLTKGESELHARVKCQVAHYLKENNYKVYSEVTFKNNKRADLIGIHEKAGLVFAFEILNSEKEDNIKDYPIEIIKIKAKEFDYKEFKI